MTAQSGVAAAPSAGAVFSLALRLSPQERRSAQKVAAGAAKRADRRRRSGEARRKSPQERRSALAVLHAPSGSKSPNFIILSILTMIAGRFL